MGKLNVVIPATNVIVDGVEYRKVEREAQVGDIVRITDEDAIKTEYLTHNGFYNVTEVDSSGDPHISDDDGDDFDLCAWTYEVYENATVLVPKRLTVEDYAKVIAKGTHDYEVGSVVKITVDENDFQPYKAERVDGTVGNWLREREVVRATDDEVAAAKAALDITKRQGDFKPGDIAKIVSVSAALLGFSVNDKVTVAEYDSTGCTYALKVTKGDLYGFCDSKHIVRVTEEEIAQEAITARWAAIGRKVNEYKAGDIVEITQNVSIAGVKIGDIEVVDSMRSEGVALTKINPQGLNAWLLPKFVKLVTPVEQRFDRVG